MLPGDPLNRVLHIDLSRCRFHVEERPDIFSETLVKTVDFYTNASKDQLDWSTSSRPTYNVSVYNKNIGRLVKHTLHTKAFLLEENEASALRE